MLQDIVDTKTDSEILGFLLTAPPRSFSVIELSKRLRASRSKTSHSLNKLVGEGVLEVFSKKSKKYYLLNPRYKLLEDMKTYWRRGGLKYQDELFSAIKRLGSIKAAFLSGLFSGEPNLPVDLLLVGKINLNKLSEFLKSLEQLMGQEVNYSIMSVEEFLLRRDTFDKFIKDIFDYPHVTVVDELAKKKSGR